MTASPSKTFQIVRMASCVTENAAMLLVGVCAQRGDVKRLRLTDTAGGDREDSREHVRGRNQEDGEERDWDSERRHEDRVHGDPAAIRSG
jgi:hypothetical protein